MKDSYIKYLSQYQEHLFFHEGGVSGRKYIGVVLEINHLSYFAPLSSFKSKHKKMKEGVEASTYAVVGSAIDSILGLTCNKFLFSMLISRQWGDPWTIPWLEMGIIILIVALSVILAVCMPTKKIHNMSIVDTISAQ